MKYLYIDFVHSLPTRYAKFHGGANYTKTLLLNLDNYISNMSNGSYNVILLWPNDYLPQDRTEQKIYNSCNYSIKRVSTTLDRIEYNANSILYIPLLGVSEFPLLRKIKIKNQDLKIILTVHGLRLLDLQIDRYDTFYNITLGDTISYCTKDVILFPLKKIFYIWRIRRYLPYCNVVTTVSNYSLSRIYNFSKIDNIVYLKQDTAIKAGTFPKNNLDNNFMLFVSGNRKEKNLARTLDAYKRYILKDRNIKRIIITGINDKLSEKLINAFELRELVENKTVVFKKYVSYEELIDLYSNAAYLIYTSKSEGYGLPVLEAAYLGCPSLVSVGTSIPEVLGNAAKYVSPYSVESIKAGMEWMDNYVNRKMIIDSILSTLEGIKENIRISNEYLYQLLLPME